MRVKGMHETLVRLEIRGFKTGQVNEISGELAGRGDEDAEIENWAHENGYELGKRPKLRKFQRECRRDDIINATNTEKKCRETGF